MVAQLELTPTERRLMDVLKDGLPHGKAELRACLNDELACEAALHMAVHNLRRKLVEVGKNVVVFRGEWMLMQRIQNTAE
jgi:hypothetical protein